MKADRREILYRFLTNSQESELIESRYSQSDCSSLSAFFRQVVVNDMVLQSSEVELQNVSLLLKHITSGLQQLADEGKGNRISEIEREANAAWQQLQSIQSTLHRCKH